MRLIFNVLMIIKVRVIWCAKVLERIREYEIINLKWGSIVDGGISCLCLCDYD